MYKGEQETHASNMPGLGGGSGTTISTTTAAPGKGDTSFHAYANWLVSTSEGKTDLALFIISEITTFLPLAAGIIFSTMTAVKVAAIIGTIGGLSLSVSLIAEGIFDKNPSQLGEGLIDLAIQVSYKLVADLPIWIAVAAGAAESSEAPDLPALAVISGVAGVLEAIAFLATSYADFKSSK
jgi:hypothetical protein